MSSKHMSIHDFFYFIIQQYIYLFSYSDFFQQDYIKLEGKFIIFNFLV